LAGNDAFEGFSVDLMNAIAKYLNFNVTFKVESISLDINYKQLTTLNLQEVRDGKYGGKGDDGVWDGLVKEVIDVH